MLMSHVLPTLGLIAGLALLLNSGYLVSGAQPALFYLVNVAFHTAGGVLLLPLLLLTTWRLRQWCQRTAPCRSASLATASFWLLVAGLFAGVGLIILGNYRPQRWLLYTHIGLSSAAVTFFLLAFIPRQSRDNFSPGQGRVWRLVLLTTMIAVLIPGVLVALRLAQPDPYGVEDRNFKSHFHLAPCATRLRRRPRLARGDSGFPSTQRRPAAVARSKA
jgi:hypothetical protein